MLSRALITSGAAATATLAGLRNSTVFAACPNPPPSQPAVSCCGSHSSCGKRCGNRCTSNCNAIPAEYNCKVQVKDLPMYNDDGGYTLEPAKSASPFERMGNYVQEKAKNAEMRLKLTLLNSVRQCEGFTTIERPEDLALCPTDAGAGRRLLVLGGTTVGGFLVGTRGCPTPFRRLACPAFGICTGLCLCYPYQAVALTRCVGKKLVGRSKKEPCDHQKK